MYFVLIAIIIFIDQIIKYLIYSNMDLYDSIPIINNIFHITYVRNFGAAFSILQNQQKFFISMTLIVVIIIFFVIFVYKRKLHTSVIYSLSFIVAGAIGNVIDRIRWGYVTDFLDFRFWPVFNVADMSIVFGAIILTVYILWIEPKSNSKG